MNDDSNSKYPSREVRHALVSLDRTEVYLYGTLLALVKEQLEAIEQHIHGRLGLWGKLRFQSRTKAIAKVVFKLMEHKQDVHGGDALQRITDDIDGLSGQGGIWSDVTPAQLEYVRNLLRIL